MALIYMKGNISLVCARASTMVDAIERQETEDGVGKIKGPAVEEWGAQAREARGSYMPEPVVLPVYDPVWEPVVQKRRAYVELWHQSMLVRHLSSIVIAWAIVVLIVWATGGL